MRLTYDETIKSWCVGDEPLLDFYIRARQDSGIPVTRLESELDLPHRALYYHEHNYHATKRPNKTVGTLLRALQHLGYDIELSQRTR